ncbi:MAG TPA: ThuA domain-containing protein [Planctomycetota bacterium]|nr:ThuA domain-containing protein [Planctomycetota bacterium]
MRLASLLCLLLSVTFALRAADEDIDPYDQSQQPLEVDTTDPKLTKIVLVAGSRSHGPGDHEFFAGTSILFNMLKQTPGVFPVMARDGWPKDPKIFEGAKAIFFYMDGGGGHPVIKTGRMELLQPYIDKGVGFVCAHYAVEYPGEKNAELKAKILTWLGGYYETGWSINPHWDAEIKALPDHPITRGVKPFKTNDEWYYNMRWPDEPKGITHILKATPPDKTRGTPEAKKHPGREEIMAWAFERADGGRSFGFTGGHRHANWGNENFRRLMVNALLWSAKLEVPAEGAKCDLNPDDLWKNLDFKGDAVAAKMRERLQALKKRVAELEKENAELKKGK